MTKRARDTRLTREQIEAGDYGEEDEGQAGADQSTQRATAEQLSQRKILKVRRHIQSTGEVKNEAPSKPSFQLVGTLSSTAAPAAANGAPKPTFSFAPATAAKKEEPAKAAEVSTATTAPASKNLFGSGAKIFTPATGGSFAGVSMDKVKQQTPSSLFGGASQPSSTLFGGAAAAADKAKEPLFKPIQGGTFGGVKLPEAKKEEPAKEAEAKPVNSLFGAPKTGTSLFGNLNTIKPAEEGEQKKTGLFGGNTVTTGAESGQKFGLFGANTQSDASKPAAGGLFGSAAGAAPATGSLFGNTASTGGGLFGNKPPTGGSLFGQPPAGSSGSLFGNAGASGSGGLFSNANQGPSLFAFKPADKKEEDNDDDDNGEEEGEKSPPIYADSTTKVTFAGSAQPVQPSPYTRIFEKHVNTFKVVKSEGPLRKISPCDLSIEFAETNGKKVYLIVVRQAKKVLIQGTLNGKVSRCRKVEEKSAKNQLKIAIQQTIETTVEKDGQQVKKPKIIFPFCAVNFSRQEEMLNFETEFKKAVEELKKDATTS